METNIAPIGAASVNFPDGDFTGWLKATQAEFADDPKATLTAVGDGLWVDSPLGRHQITQGVDEDGDPYLIVATPFPDGVYVEIESNTYGQVYGFRIYAEDE